MLKKHWVLLVSSMVVYSIILMGCSNAAAGNPLAIDPQFSQIANNTVEITPTPFQAITNTPSIIPPSYTPTSTFTPLPTNTPTLTDTPTPTLTPSLIWNPPGDVIAPILLYHHVSDTGAGGRYYIRVDDFRAQMKSLHDWGYSTITTSDLVEVLINGGELPRRPVIITFDDGNIDIYENAFPILREMGFVGVFYIVANRLGSNGFVSIDQLKEMADAGWEIGSHSMTHADLTVDNSIARFEILQSRLTLEEAIGEPVQTFAYPYGRTDKYTSDKVSEYGYRAGMGLGLNYEHTLGTLYYLNRIEIEQKYDLSKFASLLPWADK